MVSITHYPVLHLLALICIPLIGLLINGFFYKNNPAGGARVAAICVGGAFLVSFVGLFFINLETNQELLLGFRVDGLALLMSTLILFVSFIIHQFSRRYMIGDSNYRAYFLKLTGITITALGMVVADNLLLLWAAWIGSTVLLTLLMIHKSQWASARNSGVLALNTLLPGSLAMLLAFILLYQAVGSLSVFEINSNASEIPSMYLTGVLVLLFLCAFTQSAQWPFHRWLNSSLNSPTPVSALMHAGLVNGGGFLLVRFAPLILAQENMLIILFIIGAITALLGTLWKLVQTDIKRMLANSTIAQMGFMMMQCGLGLFPAAVAHLCWHGLFKAYLFLNSGSALKGKKELLHHKDTPFIVYPAALLVGLIGAVSFAFISEKSLFTLQPTTLLVGFAFISGTQLAYSMLRGGAVVKKILPVTAIVALLGAFYGESISLIQSFFPAYSVSDLPELNGIHMMVFGIFLTLWLAMNFKEQSGLTKTKLWSQLYVRALNGGQPHPKTITATRKNYEY